MTAEILECYRVLGIKPGASVKAIKAAYHKLVNVWHPDRFHNDAKQNPIANEKLKQINPAYKKLLLFWAGSQTLTYENQRTSSPLSPKQEYEVAEKYFNGDGVEKNVAEAINWIRKAAEHGYAQAQHELGSTYYYGTEIGKNPNEAIKWFREAARQNFKTSRDRLETIYADGWGAPKEAGERLQWFLEAAKDGFVSAQRTVGRIYEVGENVQKDYWESIKWYLRAAESGDMDVPFQLACLYAEPLIYGFQNPPDYKRAFKWFYVAAEQGESIAQYSVGEMYENGKGVAINYSEALNWYRKAAKNGYKLAEGKLTNLPVSEGLTISRSVFQKQKKEMRRKATRKIK